MGRLSSRAGRTTATVVAVSAAALAGLAGAPVEAAPAAPGPGAPGIGDPYYPTDGNGGYDASHYAASIDVSADGTTIRSRSVMTARSTQALSRFDLDLVGLSVDAIEVNGRPASWTRSGDHELVITPATPIASGKQFTTVVRYHGQPGLVTTPDGFQNGWFPSPDGASAIGEPPSVMVWMPVNEHPLDKATYDLRIEVGSGKAGISNGYLVDRIAKPHGRTVWVWHAPDPMASYLVLLSVGDYKVTTRTTASGIRLIDAVDADAEAAARPSIDREPEILSVLAKAFGPYPFRVSGGVVNDVDTGFALETQTRPTYEAADFSGVADDDDWILAHELTHQWFGDSVSLTKWQDIWLNEGFANYGEWLWADHLGQFTPAEARDYWFAEIPADDPFWALDMSDPQPEHLFNDPVYLRGAMVLQALRDQVGDEAFFRTLRTWTREHRGGHGTTTEFIALAEQVSGQDLTDLFGTWLFSTTKPTTPTPLAATSARPVKARAVVAEIRRHARELPAHH